MISSKMSVAFIMSLLQLLLLPLPAGTGGSGTGGGDLLLWHDKKGTTTPVSSNSQHPKPGWYSVLKLQCKHYCKEDLLWEIYPVRRGENKEVK